MPFLGVDVEAVNEEEVTPDEVDVEKQVALGEVEVGIVRGGGEGACLTLEGGDYLGFDGLDGGVVWVNWAVSIWSRFI